MQIVRSKVIVKPKIQSICGSTSASKSVLNTEMMENIMNTNTMCFELLVYTGGIG